MWLIDRRDYNLPCSLLIKVNIAKSNLMWIIICRTYLPPRPLSSIHPSTQLPRTPRWLARSPCTSPDTFWVFRYILQSRGLGWRRGCLLRLWFYAFNFCTSRRPHWWWMKWTRRHTTELSLWHPWQSWHCREEPSSWFCQCWRWAESGNS